MRAWRRVAALACMWLLAWPRTGAAEGLCERLDDGMAEAPVQASLRDGNLGLGRRPCPRTDLGLGARGLVIADFDDFYGNLVASAELAGGLALGESTELWAELEVLRYQSVISSVVADYFGLGHSALGVTRVLATDPEGVLSWQSRLVLPTAFGLYDNVTPFALDSSLTGQWRLHPVVHLHGQVGVLSSAAMTKGASQPRVGATVAAGGRYRPAHAFAMVLELKAEMGYADTLDVLALDVALRTALGEHLGGELGATLPLAGRERALAAALLRFTYRF